MEKEFIESQKQKLLGEKARLEREIPEENKYPEMGTSMEDAAQETGELNDTNAIKINLARELKAVNAALKRINDGTYGICQQCGGEIDKNRLIAYPAANRCVEPGRHKSAAPPMLRQATPSEAHPPSLKLREDYPIRNHPQT